MHRVKLNEMDAQLQELVKPAQRWEDVVITQGDDISIVRLVTSETLDDTNEGFDVTLPKEFGEDDLSIYLIKPRAGHMTPCNEDVYKPWAWASAVWR